MMTPEVFDARLVAARSLSPGVRELTLERSDGKVFQFEPGQWVNLVLPLPGEEVKRAYSIASGPTGTTRFELAVTRVEGGPGSEYLHRLAEGSTLRAIGPHGLFTRAPLDDTPALFVATGTGVTPLRSMLQAARRAGSRAPIWLLFGARFEEDILYRDELEAMAREGLDFRFEVTLSQPRDGAAPGGPVGEARPARPWTGRRGYVQAHVPALYRELAAAVAPAKPHVYICGLERMVKSVKELVRGELGVDRKHVHTERYD